MTDKEKAKILLQYGSYKKYIFLLLDKDESEMKTPIIEDILNDVFSNFVDPTDISEELYDHEDLDIDTEDIDECTFQTWQDAWIFYEDEVVEETVKQLLVALNISIEESDLTKEVYKIVEEEAKDMIF